MSDQASLTNFDGAEDRRKFQNRMAQRKYREKIKARRQSSCSERHRGLLMSDDNYKPADQSGPRCQTLNRMLHEFNILQSTNGVQGQTTVPQMDTNTPSLQRERVHSSMSTCSPGEGDQPFNDQFFFLDPSQSNNSYEVEGHQKCPEETRQEFIPRSRDYTNNQDIDAFTSKLNLQQDNELTKQATAVVQNQRIRICDQAEQYLEKVLSLYDFGVSLDILVANSNLRDLLVKASVTFDTQRFIDEPGKVELTKDQ